MRQNKVTREELRNMKVGQTRIILFEDAKKLASARITINQLKNEEGLEFEYNQDWQTVAMRVTRKK